MSQSLGDDTTTADGSFEATSDDMGAGSVAFFSYVRIYDLGHKIPGERHLIICSKGRGCKQGFPIVMHTMHET